MVLSTKTKLNLVDTDPMLAYNINEGPQPEDDYLNIRLGREYQQYEKLRQDTHIHSRLQRRRLAVLGRRLAIKPASDKRRDKKAIDILDVALSHINYEQLCNDLIDSGMLIGFSAVGINWVQKENLLLPEFTFIPQYRFNFAHYRESDYSVPVATGEQLNQRLPVSEQIAMQNGYEVRLLTKRSPTRGERIPRGRIILYSFGSSQGLPWGRGLGYQIWSWRQIKKEARNAWLLHSDRLGSPPTAGTYDEELINLSNPTHSRAYDNFANFLQTISPNGYGVFPKGFEVNLVEAINSSSPDVHERLINLSDMQITEAILGEASFAERSSGGSFAANSSQQDERESSLTDADCNLLDAQLKEQLWKPFFELNAAQAQPPTIKRWTTEDDKEIEAEALKESTRGERAKADEVLVRSGFTPTDEYVKETYGDNWSASAQVATPDPVTPAIELREWTQSARAELATGKIKGGFAGPNNSFPIASPSDVNSAWRLAGQASKPNEIRRAIIRIAKRFDWLSGLPESAVAWAEENSINLSEELDFAGAGRFVTWKHFRIGIENEVGSERFDRPMRVAYGYFVNHVGDDKEALDVYIGPHFSSDRIFRIRQLDQMGEFDEYKYGLLFNTSAQFERAYKRQMPSRFFGGIEEVSIRDIECCTKSQMFNEGGGRYGHINFKPPMAVQMAFKSAINNNNLKIGSGMEASTKTWARKLANGEKVSVQKARMGYRFFKRNARFASAPKDSPAWAAWAYWAGRAGQSWFNKLWRQMEAADKAKGINASELRLIPPDDCLEFLTSADPLLPGDPTTFEGVIDIQQYLESKSILTASEQATKAWVDRELDRYVA